MAVLNEAVVVIKVLKVEGSSDWPGLLVSSAVALVAAGIGALALVWTTSKSRRQALEDDRQLWSEREGEARRSALHALHAEFMQIYLMRGHSTHGWTHLPMPVDAYQAARPFLSDLETADRERVYKAASMVAEYNAIAGYANTRNSSLRSPDVPNAIKDISDFAETVAGHVGSSIGDLERLLGLPVTAQ